MSFDLLGILYRIYVRLFNEKDFESEGRKERKNKRIKSMEIMRYTENIN